MEATTKVRAGRTAGYKHLASQKVYARAANTLWSAAVGHELAFSLVNQQMALGFHTVLQHVRQAKPLNYPKAEAVAALANYFASR